MKAELVLPGRWVSLCEKAPALEVLGNPLLRVKDEMGGEWWVDPTHGEVSHIPPLVGRVTLFITDGGSVRRAKVPIRVNRVEVSLFWDLDKGEGRAEGFLAGPVAEGLGLDSPEKAVRNWVGEWWRAKQN